MFKNKTLLITGGTGSFGSEVLKAFLNSEVGEIRIFSRDEKKQSDMRIEYGSEKLKFYLGDVRDYESIRPAFQGADYVFHAAALKQVPSCEFHPLEAIKTNVLGTENVLTAAIESGVQKAIVLSTDKAVYPINAMGMTKGLLEKIMVAKSRMLSEKQTLLCGTRYGNVIGTRGSVVPLFIKQIKAGDPLTITDPEMTRFLMPLEEALKLVMVALQNGRQGDLFVQKSPACTIGDLAAAIKELFKAKNKIVTIGTRHGEKRHETLLTRDERARCEDLGDYFRILPDIRDLNYNKYFVEGEQRISSENDYTSSNTTRLKVSQIIETLREVPYIQSELKAYFGKNNRG